MINKKKIFISLFFILAAAVLLFYYFLKPKSNDWVFVDDIQNTLSNNKVYENKELGISLQYPGNWPDLVLIKQEMDGNFATGSAYIINNIYGPNGVFSFTSLSKDYTPFGAVTTFNKKPIDPNWTKEELIASANTLKGYIYFAKKFNDNSLLIANYWNLECSPSLVLTALVPLDNPDYPNLEMQINYPFYNDTLIKEYEKQQEARGEDACDQLEVYRKVTEKIEQGGFNKELIEYLKIANEVTASVKKL